MLIVGNDMLIEEIQQAKLNQDERALFKSLLMTVGNADGGMTSLEIQFIEKMFHLLSPLLRQPLNHIFLILNHSSGLVTAYSFKIMPLPILKRHSWVVHLLFVLSCQLL